MNIYFIKKIKSKNCSIKLSFFLFWRIVQSNFQFVKYVSILVVFFYTIWIWNWCTKNFLTGKKNPPLTHKKKLILKTSCRHWLLPFTRHLMLINQSSASMSIWEYGLWKLKFYTHDKEHTYTNEFRKNRTSEILSSYKWICHNGGWVGFEHEPNFLITSILSAIVDPAVPTKPSEAQLQTVFSIYRRTSVRAMLLQLSHCVHTARPWPASASLFAVFITNESLFFQKIQLKIGCISIQFTQVTSGPIGLREISHHKNVYRSRTCLL